MADTGALAVVPAGLSGQLARLLPDRGPRRVLALATGVNSVGNGMFMTSIALYLTRSVGLRAVEVGLALGIGAVIGLVAGIPVGNLADQHGPRETYRLTLLVEAAAMAGFVLVHNLASLIVVIGAVELASSASKAARAPLIRGFGGGNPVAYRGYLRCVTNLGIALGALAAGFALQLDTRTGYLSLLLGNGVTFLLCSAIVWRLPHLPPVVRPAEAARWQALRDRPFAVLTALNGALAVQYSVLTFAIPLWVVGHTHAPRWTVSAALMLNTLIVVVLQVRASRGVDSPDGAARALRRMGLTLLIGFALIAWTSALPAWAAIGMLLGAVALCTLGELWYAAAGFEISYGLPAPHAQGQYTGVFNIGLGVGTACSPAVLSLLCLSWGRPGWCTLGLLMLLLGLATGWTMRWAQRTRSVSS
ncbi:MAG TPA: MFS transporter [Jatrophihabitans sp.]|nr:MFS transporter [Jatrophihabitans sp.]